MQLRQRLLSSSPSRHCCTYGSTPVSSSTYCHIIDLWHSLQRADLCLYREEEFRRYAPCCHPQQLLNCSDWQAAPRLLAAVLVLAVGYSQQRLLRFILGLLGVPLPRAPEKYLSRFTKGQQVAPHQYRLLFSPRLPLAPC